MYNIQYQLFFLRTRLVFELISKVNKTKDPKKIIFTKDDRSSDISEKYHTTFSPHRSDRARSPNNRRQKTATADRFFIILVEFRKAAQSEIKLLGKLGKFHVEWQHSDILIQNNYKYYFY